MTETEWLACGDPMCLAAGLPESVSDRKVRLLGAACCRRVAHLINEAGCRAAIDVVERYADGLITVDELRDAEQHLADQLPLRWGPATRKALEAVANATRARVGWHYVYVVLKQAARAYARDPALGLTDVPGWDAATLVEQRQQLELGRCVFGNPFRTVAVDPSWLTSTVVALAQGIYADRAFDRLPILADALQDAGCENADILTHLRGDGPHVRGCWALDLILGKE